MQFAVAPHDSHAGHGRDASGKCAGCDNATKIFVSSGRSAKWCSRECATAGHSSRVAFKRAPRSGSRACVDCGELLGSLTYRGFQRRRCRECRDKRDARIQRKLAGVTKTGITAALVGGHCKQCKAPMLGTLRQWDLATGWRKYCSATCRNDAERDRRSRKPVECERCHKAYVPKAANRLRFCSRQCSYQAAHAKSVDRVAAAQSPFSKVYFSTCDACNRPFGSRRPRKCCSYECNSRLSLASYHERKAVQHHEQTVCKGCNVTFTALWWHGFKHSARKRKVRFCAPECGIKFARRAMGSNHRRRARRAGVTYEPVNRFKVFERDGWRCQLCYVETPRSLFRKPRGDNTLNAPELDHVVPLARGGAHVMANCQCLCRACNHIKGAMTMDEARVARHPITTTRAGGIGARRAGVVILHQAALATAVVLFQR
jgi:HNH endonuclease